MVLRVWCLSTFPCLGALGRRSLVPPVIRTRSALTGPLKKSLDEVEELYTRLGTAVFTQTRLKGTTKLLWEHSYYDTEAWRIILQQNLGMLPLIGFSRDQAVPKVGAPAVTSARDGSGSVTCNVTGRILLI